MLRGVALAAVSLTLLASPLVAGAAPGPSAAGSRTGAGATDTITLRARLHQGAWRRSLSLHLVKLRLTSFSLCAIWDHRAGDPFDCDAASKTRLPEGTTLRLEQSPIAKAVKRADSPGWGMLGASPDGALGAVLSNLVTGNHTGTFHYRVTLRDRAQKILVSSNTFTVVWR